MAENLLVEFIDGCDKHIQAEKVKDNNSELAVLLELHKEQSVKVLKKLFEPNYFETPIDKPITNVWLKYHMYQSKHNLGALMLVFEICHLIYGMIEKDGLPKIRNYLFPKGLFNERQLRAHLLEFFTTLMFTQDGLRTFHDVPFRPETPLDVIVVFNGEERLIECKSIQEPEVFDFLFTFSMKLQRMLHGYAENPGQSIRLVQKVPFSYYLVGKTEKDFKKNSHELFAKVKAYVLDGNQPEPPAISGKPYEAHVEKYQEGLFENYMAAFESYKFVVVGKIGSSYVQSLPHLPIKHEGKISDLKDRMTKIKRAIKDKRDQHKNKNFKSKLYILEIESFTGPSMGFELEKLDETELMKEIRVGETVWIIHKDSRGNQIPKRIIKMVTRDNDNAWVERLEQLIENKMKNSMMRILSEKMEN